jgi:hypothetical protein
MQVIRNIYFIVLYLLQFKLINKKDMSTNTDKKTIKQLSVDTEVSDVAVWVEKDKTMRRIGKAAFDTAVASQPTITTDKIVPRTSGGDITLEGPLKITTAGDGLGYGTGAGGTRTQITSITTGVGLNAICGEITTVSSTLAAGADATFSVTNTAFETGDVVIVHTKSYGGTADGIPICNISSVDGATNTFSINIRNTGAVALDAVIVISFAIVKAVTA